MFYGQIQSIIQAFERGVIVLAQFIRLFKAGKPITIEQGTNKFRLPLFYAIPKEMVRQEKSYLDFPRCPYEPIWTDLYEKQINDDSFLQLIMDSYAFTFWQFIDVPDGKGGYKRMTESFNHYSGDFPVWTLCYMALSPIQEKIGRFGYSFQNLGRYPRGKEVPWQSYEDFASEIAAVAPEIIKEQNWQPLIDDAWLNRTQEDYSTFSSRAKTDFYRAWNHSRTKIGTMESLDPDESTAESVALGRENFEDEIISKLRIDDFVKTLSPRDQRIWELKAQHYTDLEIAAEVGYSTHSAVVKRLRHMAECYDQYVQNEYEDYLRSFD